jgi:serine/threonine-protein kinase
MLPGGESVLFTIGTPAGNVDWDKAQLVVQTLKSGARKTLHDGGSDGRFLPTGNIVYALRGTLFAIPFDLKRLEVTGGAVPLVEGVQRSFSGAAQFGFSGNGSLIYVPGPVSGTGASQISLAIIDRKGTVEPLKLAPGPYSFPRVSLDGKRVAYESDDGKESSVWVAEISGEHNPNRITLAGTGTNRFPIWSSDGLWVAFQSNREGDQGIWRQRTDGTGTAERLTKPEKGISHVPDSWSPDGQTFSFTEVKGNQESLWTFSLRDKKASVYAEVPGSSLGRSVFSPDGRWLVYQQRDAQSTQIYVQTYPFTTTKHQISKGGTFNRHPVWSSDGKELFYVDGLGSQVADVSVTFQPTFTFRILPPLPRPFTPTIATNIRNHDILPDGKHFLGVVAVGQTTSGQTGPAAPQIQVVLNWFVDVKQRMTER